MILALAVPFTAQAALSPWVYFGGRVLTINYCINGAVQFVIKPAGVFPITYIWTPLTKHNYIDVRPPLPPFPGEEILGTALPGIIVCVGPGLHPLSYFGLPVVFEAQSFSL